jgi:hypothetical protein
MTTVHHDDSDFTLWAAIVHDPIWQSEYDKPKKKDQNKWQPQPPGMSQAVKHDGEKDFHLLS